jgi:DNA-binding NarL/FixJ family response regulator
MSIRVLLVDDHALFRDGIHRLLTANGMTIAGEAADGAEGVRQYRALRPDLVLMDLSMPVMTGLEATRLIKAEWPEARVVILTASEAEVDLFEAVKSGAAGYILKSSAPDAVVEMLVGAAAGQPALTPDLASKILAEFARVANAGPATAAADRGDVDELIEPLTVREREVLELLVTGATNRRIAETLVVTENTVKYHLKNILQKLHLHNRAEVVAFALGRGMTG